MTSKNTASAWAAAALALATLGAGAARAADFVTIPLEATVAAPADVVWKKVGGWCDIGAWLKTTCVITSGGEEMGAVRLIAGRIEELMVAKTAWSYSYSQPKSPIDYHGTVEVRPIDKKTSKLLYTLVYDAEPLKTPEAKAADKDRRAKMFTGVLQAMKGIAEAK
ncbi:MAG: SRPBCC family protein [Phenylobacterium sp.]